MRPTGVGYNPERDFFAVSYISDEPVPSETWETMGRRFKELGYIGEVPTEERISKRSRKLMSSAIFRKA